MTEPDRRPASNTKKTLQVSDEGKVCEWCWVPSALAANKYGNPFEIPLKDSKIKGYAIGGTVYRISMCSQHKHLKDIIFQDTTTVTHPGTAVFDEVRSLMKSHPERLHRLFYSVAVRIAGVWTYRKKTTKIIKQTQDLVAFVLKHYIKEKGYEGNLIWRFFGLPTEKGVFVGHLEGTSLKKLFVNAVAFHLHLVKTSESKNPLPNATFHLSTWVEKVSSKVNEENTTAPGVTKSPKSTPSGSAAPDDYLEEIPKQVHPLSSSELGLATQQSEPQTCHQSERFPLPLSHSCASNHFGTIHLYHPTPLRNLPHNLSSKFLVRSTAFGGYAKHESGFCGCQKHITVELCHFSHDAPYQLAILHGRYFLRSIAHPTQTERRVAIEFDLVLVRQTMPAQGIPPNERFDLHCDANSF
ncbi:hypothetical protein T439DRAFT_332719 [Meredithblackwellia eburnea MCA 4105]